MAKDKTPKEAPAEPAVVPAPSLAESNGIEVADPQVLRPVDLPLVIKPADGGEWKNPEQAAYAKVLNAAAYANKNWASVKEAEIARLVEIGVDPSRFYFYTGSNPMQQGLTYGNKLIG